MLVTKNRRIPQSFIDELLARADIVRVIGERVKLKKTGKNYSACCPFHQEKTPSFTVSPEKQFYYCFGCGASGNALGFVIDHERKSFREAIETLAAGVGISVPTEGEREVEDNLAPLFQVMNRALLFYQSQLNDLEIGKTARHYLRSRQLSKDICETYAIGYAPEGWDTLTNHFNDTHLTPHLVNSGLCVQKQPTRVYDRFRHRIMFPIRDPRGRTIGFGGRVLDDTKPKYLNSPETPCFDKSQTIYGLYELRQNCRQPNSIVVVEGYMDVIALAQHGIFNSVATLGTAISTAQIRRLFRETKEIVFCFDGDNAGKQAAERAMMTALPLMEDQFIVKFLFLPPDEDPDTVVRKIGAAHFTSMLAHDATTLTDQIIIFLNENHPGQSLDHRIALLRASRDIVAQFPQGLYRTLLVDKICQHTQLSRELIEKHLEFPEAEQDIKSSPDKPPTYHKAQPTPLQTSDYREHPVNLHVKKSPKPHLARNRLPLAQSLIQTMLNDLNSARNTTIPAQLHSASLPDVQALIDLHITIKTNPNMTVAGLMGHYMGTEMGKLIAKLSANVFILEQQQSSATLTDGWRQIHLQQLQDELNRALGKPQPNKDEIRNILKSIAEAKKKENTAEPTV